MLLKKDKTKFKTTFVFVISARKLGSQRCHNTVGPAQPVQPHREK
jgi:hypothetical protein